MIDFEKRLQGLKDRRQGSKERALFFAADSAENRIYKALNAEIRKSEGYERLSETPGVKYAIGAMAPVDRGYTDVSIREGERVADNLTNAARRHNLIVVKRLQGSVALDIHIRGYSDVDMLLILSNPVLIEMPEVSIPSAYLPSTDSRPMVEILRELRSKSEALLKEGFPAAAVDGSNNKSISIEGGSLGRKVDIVPACWYDSRTYQQSQQEFDRGVKVYHKGDHQLHMNYPFQHAKLVNELDQKYGGNLKCVIRFLKNLIADMPDSKKNIAKKLTSFDLMAISYHMGDMLQLQSYMRLGLIEKTRIHLEILRDAHAYRDLLLVPDGTRKIFDSTDKVKALALVTEECAALSQAIFRELRPLQQVFDSSVILNKAII